MKIIEPTQDTGEKDSVVKVVDRFKHILQLGMTDEYAEEAIIAKFMRGLDNNFVLLRNLILEGNGEKFPPILVGPAGLYVLNISHANGFFKAKEDTWWELNKTTRKYGQSRPNLIKQSKEIAQRLAVILETHEKPHPLITPLLIFANAGVNIERSNPAIRIVLMDGVDSFIDGLRYSDTVLQPNEVTYLADSLEILANPAKGMPVGEEEDFFGKGIFIEEKKAPLTLPDIQIPAESPLPPIEEKLKFTQKQWTILVILMFLTIVVLLVAILFALGIF